MAQQRCLGMVVLCFIGLLPLPVYPADHVLMIGGGPSAESSQLSIEQNMVYFRRALGDLGRSDLRPEVFFASGPEALPDVCLRSMDRLPRAHRLLAEILGHRHAVELEYRPHDIGPVDGPARREAIMEAIHRKGRELNAGDRLLIYVSGHGGKGEPTANGRLSTWERGEISVKDLGEALDQFKPEVDVIVVMVQCYSGAFANILFEGGNPDRPVARHRRAGFFATVDSRPAAGCSADTKIADYREYSTSFLAALCGKSRQGEAIEADDIDDDGEISFVEAHAYAVETSPTIDICFRTSDRYLQTQSRLDPTDPKLVPEQAELDELRKYADPIRRHSLEYLVQDLKLPAENAMTEAIRASKRLSFDRRRSKQPRYDAQDEADKQARQIEDDLLVRWPFLESGWHPQTQALLAEHPDDLVQAIQSHPAFAKWDQANRRAEELTEADLEKERQWAKYQRLLLVAKSIAREENLRRQGDQARIDKYLQIVAMENSTLRPTRGDLPLRTN
jgi:hypothetical protein